MSGENAQQDPAGMVELQGLPDSWVMRVLSSAWKEKTKCQTTYVSPTLLKYLKLKIYLKKSTLYCYEVSAKADDQSVGFMTYKYMDQEISVIVTITFKIYSVLLL